MIAVLIACFNRCALTLDLVSKVMAQKDDLDLYVVDGGSVDGTLEILTSWCRSNNNLHLSAQSEFYWAESMNLAWKMALNNNAKKRYDGYLLLNDDLHIDSERFKELIAQLKPCNEPEIHVGTCLDSTEKYTTYGALVRKHSKSRIHFRIAQNGESPITFNANFVYVPSGVVEKIGILSSRYRHSFADIDYGLRATKKHIPIRIIEKPVGKTDYNDAWSKSIKKLTLRNVWQILFSPKGLPINEWYLFCRRHAGPLWLFRFFFRYLRMLISR